MHPPRRTRVGAYVLAVEDGRLLMCRIATSQDAAGRWTLPGGGVRFGEDPAAAALRELEEETGLRAELAAVASVVSWVRSPVSASRPDEIHAVAIVYHGRVTGGELRPEAQGSTDMVAWLTAPEARRVPLVPIGEAAVRLAFGPPEEPEPA